ncbi:MAG TPA: type IV secretory system conjugative DNA transfer family protein [Solirubrobacteraceae bacterium]|nr:type IV secretory system conjugative DNA transfer family protein [Solirubrobacteraceae bacterium]
MNGDLTPAVVAASGGSALLAGIWLHEHRRAAAMRASRRRYRLRLPIDLDQGRARAVLDALSGLPVGIELVAEVAADSDGVTFGLHLPAAVGASVQASLAGIAPGTRLEDEKAPSAEAATRSLRLFVPTPAVLATDGTESASRALLAGLTTLGAGERVVLRWALTPGRPTPLPANDDPSQDERDAVRAWRRKRTDAGLHAAGLVLVRADTQARAAALARHIESLIRSRRGPVGTLRITSERGNRALGAMPKTTRSSGWLTSAELLGLLGWPLGADIPAGVDVGASREVLVPRTVAKAGRRIFTGRDHAGGRPVALSVEAARQHLAIVGPTGVGKSSLIANCVLADMASGYSGVVIDPKGPDLVNSILDRVRLDDARRMVVLDPADSRPSPGVAIFAGGDPDLRAEVLTGALRSIFSDVWSVRSDYYIRLGLRTLSEVPGATLADLGRLFFEAGYRRAAVARLADPFLASAWQHYERGLSSGDRAAHVAAPMARVMALLNMPRVRGVLASPDPKVEVGRLLEQRKWLLVSLSPGQLGEGPSTFIAAALVYVVWSAIESRSAVTVERRLPAALYVDELASLTAGVPFSFELLAERARGLGAALTVSMQTLGRIPEPTRSSLLGNVATLVSFRAAADDAARLARELPGLGASDLMALGAFEVGARVATGIGSAVSVMTGYTEPLPETTGLAEEIRERSARRYGAAGPATSPSTAPLLQAPETEEPLGRKRRRS